MVVPTGHQVRCIHWVPVAIFNQEIGFLCRTQFFALNKFCGILTTISMFDDANMFKKLTIKDASINNHELLSIHVCSFDILEQGVHPISSDTLQVLSSSPNVH